MSIYLSIALSLYIYILETSLLWSSHSNLTGICSVTMIRLESQKKDIWQMQFYFEKRNGKKKHKNKAAFWGCDGGRVASERPWPPEWAESGRAVPSGMFKSTTSGSRVAFFRCVSSPSRPVCPLSWWSILPFLRLLLLLPRFLSFLWYCVRLLYQRHIAVCIIMTVSETIFK